MKKKSQEQPLPFTRRGALMGLYSYIIVAIIVWLVFL